MAHNPELDYEFREGKPQAEKVIHVYPTSNIFPNTGLGHRAPEPDSLGHLARMGNKGVLGALKNIAIAVGAIAAVLGVMFFLSATNLLPLL